MPPDLQQLEDQLDAIERDMQVLLAGLTEEAGRWRIRPGAWSIAECLDHIATSNRVYLAAMQPAARRASQEGRVRRGPARPGIIGRLFVKSLEPPVTRIRVKAPRSFQPRPSPGLADALEAFLASQQEIRTFLRDYSGIDLAGVSFPNPFARGVRLSLATGLHVLPAHARRHLWQARQVRRAVT